MLVPRTGRIWEIVYSSGLSPSCRYLQMISHSWFGVKTSDFAVAGLLKEHLRTLQARAHNIKQKKSLSSSESSVYSTHPILNKSPTPPYIHRQIISCSSLITASKGSWLQESPYSTPSINFKQRNSTKPISTQERNPKTSAQSPMSRNEARNRSFNDDSGSGVTRWNGSGAFG